MCRHAFNDEHGNLVVIWDYSDLMADINGTLRPMYKKLKCIFSNMLPHNDPCPNVMLGPEDVKGVVFITDCLGRFIPENKTGYYRLACKKCWSKSRAKAY